MKKFDVQKFRDEINDLADKCDKYLENKVRAQSDATIIRWAQDGNTLAQAEADRRGLRY